ARRERQHDEEPARGSPVARIRLHQTASGHFLVPVRVPVLMPAGFTGCMVAARGTVVADALPPPLAATIKNGEREQDRGGDPGKYVSKRLLELESEPGDAEPQQGGQEHVSEARSGSNQIGRASCREGV